ncbi:MAG: response regulator transcription factor [Chloroflexi bacterium]|nr:response regulator transcription factor [Chloroflexota bacterium]
MLRPKVLVIEDELALADVLHSNLEGAGYDVVVTTDGLAALDAFERERPDLVTLDLRIPTISGFRLLQLIKRAQDGAGVPVIVISALSFEEGEEVAHHGADDYVTKPFEPSDLVARVDYLLRRRNGR